MVQLKQSGGKKDIVVDSDWMGTLAMAVLLLLSILWVVADIWHLARGQFTERVSFHTILLAAIPFFLAYTSAEGLLRAGLVSWGVAASLPIGAYYLHLSGSSQHLAWAVGLGLRGLGSAMIFLGIVQWFRSVMRIEERK